MTPRERLFVDGVTCRLEGDGMRVANLSVGGLFAATDRPPLPGQVVKLELDVDDRGPFEVLGRVTWVNEGQAPKAPDLPKGFGVRITQIGLPAKLAIVNALKRTRDRLCGQ